MFNVLFVAKGFKPQFARRANPLSGPLDIRLEPWPDDEVKAEHVVRGRVLDADRKPVVGASIWPTWVYYPDGTWISTSKGVDPMAISDEKGEFELRSSKPLASLDLLVEARGLASRGITRVSSGLDRHTFELDAGATLRGRLVKRGKPCPGRLIGLVQTKRKHEVFFVGEYTIGTDEQGRFLFPNVTPNFDYYVYAKMKSMAGFGATPVQEVHVGKTGTTIDIGELSILRGHRVRGRVVLADGKPVPAGTRLTMGRNRAWDSQFVELGAQGRFEFRDLPTERYSVSVHVKGYRFSARNAGLDPWNPFRLLGSVDRHIDDLVVLLEPGERLKPDGNPKRDADAPLRGAPPDVLDNP